MLAAGTLDPCLLTTPATLPVLSMKYFEIVDIMTNGTESAPVYDWQVGDRHYTLTSSTFTKRQLFPHEQTLNIDGEITQYPFSRERLENERNALLYIARNTKIPVPRVLDLSDVDRVGCLTMEALHGAILINILDDWQRASPSY